MTTDDPIDPPLIQLRIPGRWSSPREINDALREASLPYQMLEEALVNTETHEQFQWGVSEHDDEIAELFAHDRRATQEQIDLIASHDVKVHLSVPGGSIDAARGIVDAATALVRVGGFGVFVDNSGAAHMSSDWLKLAGDPAPGGLYWIFVVLSGSPEEVFSVGMHCLGLRDAELPFPGSERTAWEVMHNFLGYTYQSGIEVHDGDVLGGENGPEFKVHHHACTRVMPGTAFHNPYGLWRLEKVDD
jgi:hypothetical protein